MSKKRPLSSNIFIPDHRNIGGRVQITDLIYNHQMSLLHAKPTLKTRVSPPKSTTSKNRTPNYQEILKYKEVFESFRRSQNVKCTNFSSPPQTYHLKEMLQRKNKKAFKAAEFEHQLFLRSQKRRINDMSSLSQRKKNLFNCTCHPSLFFRNKSENIRKSSVNPGAHSQAIEEAHPESRIEEAHPENESREQLGKQKKSFENKEKENFNEENDLEEGGYELIPIPELKGKRPEDYEQLKEKLIELIYEYRIVKTDDLESLFGRTLLHNKHLDSKRLEKIFKQIQEEFDA